MPKIRLCFCEVPSSVLFIITTCIDIIIWSGFNWHSLLGIQPPSYAFGILGLLYELFTIFTLIVFLVESQRHVLLYRVYLIFRFVAYLFLTSFSVLCIMIIGLTDLLLEVKVILISCLVLCLLMEAWTVLLLAVGVSDEMAKGEPSPRADQPLYN